MLDWGDLRFFVAVARLGSLSAAARELRVEHSTVARRLDALEERLGVRLFDRLARGWRLTVEGERLLEPARRLEDDALAFERQALGSAPLAGTVRLSAPPSLARALLAQHVDTLRGGQEGLTLELVGETHSVSLDRREADLALRLQRPTAPGLVLRRVGDLRFAAYATPAYLAAHAPPQWRFLGYDESLRHVPQQQWLERVAGARPFALRSNDLDVIHRAAATGAGIAALPAFLGGGDPALVQVGIDSAPPLRTLWLVMHADVRRSPRVAAVADALAALLEREAAWVRDGTPPATRRRAAVAAKQRKKRRR